MIELEQTRDWLKHAEIAAAAAIPAHAPLALKNVEEMYKSAISIYEAECKAISEQAHWQDYLGFQDNEVSYRQHIQQVADQFGCAIKFPDHWF